MAQWEMYQQVIMLFRSKHLSSLMEVFMWSRFGPDQRSQPSDINCLIVRFLKQIAWHMGLALDNALCSGAVGDCALSMLQDQNSLQTCEELLANYWLSAREAMSRSPVIHLSGAIDKSHVHSYNIFSGAFCLPDNHAWWGVPQDRQTHQKNST